MIQAKQINILNSNVETDTTTENDWIRTENKTNKQKTPTQIKDAITKITVPPGIQALYHSLSHSI